MEEKRDSGEEKGLGSRAHATGLRFSQSFAFSSQTFVHARLVARLVACLVVHRLFVFYGVILP